MGAPFLVERGIDPSEEELGPALMMRLLLALPKEGGYFRPLAGHPTLAQALWTTVRELRMAGLGPDALIPAAFASPAKHAELVALLRAYERFLSDHKRADMATVYQEAVRHQDWCPIQSQDCWTELPDANWNPLQRRLLDSLPGERMPPRAFALAGIDIPRRLTARPTLRVSPDVVTNPLAFLMTPPSSAPAATHRPVPCRRSRSGDRRGLPTHSGHRGAARPGGNRVRVGCAHRARLGKGAAPRLAGHARHRYSRHVHAAGTRADRLLRLDRNRLRGGPLPPLAAVRRYQRRGAGRVHRRPGGARARASGSRLGARHIRLGVHALGQGLRGARRRGRCVGRRPRLRQGAGGAGEERSRLAHVAGGLHPCACQGRNRCAAGRRGRGTWRSSNVARRAATRWIIGPERHSRNTSANCARLAISPVRSPKRCASCGSACSRSRSRPNARGLVISTRAACRSRATPVAPTSSSSVSRKDASSLVRPRTRCCWTRSARASRRT